MQQLPPATGAHNFPTLERVHFGRPAAEAIATEVETMFKQRWLAKREAELTAKGSTPEAARQQARTEFNEQYKFTTVAHD